METFIVKKSALGDTWTVPDNWANRVYVVLASAPPVPGKMTYVGSCHTLSQTEVEEAMEDEASKNPALDLLDLDSVNEAFGYDRVGLNIRDDYHVQLYVGTFRGRQAITLVHSAIEWVFAA